MIIVYFIQWKAVASDHNGSECVSESCHGLLFGLPAPTHPDHGCLGLGISNIV